MANKNKHVIIAYYTGTEEAEAAAQEIKNWDKANDDIKLGGIGILAEKDGKIKTRKVGARATGKGAKWGLALGAATGILTGGVTLIGGAIAGVAGGAIVGSLFHRSLGLSDEDWKSLVVRLQKGGAALVVMGDEDEVEPTQVEMARLGGEVVNFQVPEETMTQVEAAEDVVPVDADAEEDADEIEEGSGDEVVAVMSTLVNVPGSWQSASGAGCDDWDPACSDTYLTRQDDGLYVGVFAVSPGDYEAKVALHGGWEENYGDGGYYDGANIRFSVDDSGTVTFTYDPESHILTIS